MANTLPCAVTTAVLINKVGLIMDGMIYLQFNRQTKLPGRCLVGVGGALMVGAGLSLKVHAHWLQAPHSLVQSYRRSRFDSVGFCREYSHVQPSGSPCKPL